MSIFYSASTMGFYFESVHGENIPKDALQIDAVLYKSLQDAQSIGQTITSDTKGIPYASHPQVTIEDQKNSECMRITRELDRIRDELEKVQDSDSKAIGTVSQWRDYRKALRSWPEHLEFPKPEFRPKAPDVQ